jgi:Ca2+-binding RTX toxin-like protein
VSKSSTVTNSNSNSTANIVATAPTPLALPTDVTAVTLAAFASTVSIDTSSSVTAMPPVDASATPASSSNPIDTPTPSSDASLVAQALTDAAAPGTDTSGLAGLPVANVDSVPVIAASSLDSTPASNPNSAAETPALSSTTNYSASGANSSPVVTAESTSSSIDASSLALNTSSASSSVNATAASVSTFTPPALIGPFVTIDNYVANSVSAGAHYGVVAQADAAAHALLAADSGIQIVASSAILDAAGQAVALYDGSITDIGRDGSTGHGIGAGLVMTSGMIGGFTNTLSYYGADNARAGDTGLNSVVNTVFHTSSYDAAVLEFKFTIDPSVATNTNSVSFNLVFGSDEFPEWMDSYVDSAAVWVNGTNYALFDHSEYNPLSVVSQNVYAGYFQNNTDAHLNTEYDGLSNLLRITAPIHDGVNTIRIAIADTGDHVLDSAIYIADMKAGFSQGSGVTSIDHQGSSLDDSAHGTQMAESFDLSSGNDLLTAGGGDDIVDSGDGNDDVSGDTGNDVINGGAGDDSARYHGNRVDFSVTQQSNGSYAVVDLRDGSPDGTDTLINVEKLHFDDGTFTIDSLVGGATPNSASPPAAAAPTVADTTAPLAAAAATADAPVATAAAASAATDNSSAVGDAVSANPVTALDSSASPPVIDESATSAAAAQVAAAAAQAAADAEAAAKAQAAEAAAAQATLEAAKVAADALAKEMAGYTLSGTLGSDSLHGGMGNDTLDGGVGADQMDGGKGNDSYYVDDKKDVVSEAAGEGSDTIYSSTTFTLSANVENLTLTGTGSNDATGNALDNILTGNSAKNVLMGGAGNDIIFGGGGIDQLTGGSGNDLFVFSSVSDSLVGSTKHDVITDFQQGDMIDLSQIDAIIGTACDDAFSYLGSGAFTGVAGQLHFDAATGNISGDVNGDGKADFEINLAGVHTAPSYDSFHF